MKIQLKKSFYFLFSICFILLTAEFIVRNTNSSNTLPSSPSRLLALCKNQYGIFRPFYFIEYFIQTLIPYGIWNNFLELHLIVPDKFDRDEIEHRVNYYCKLMPRAISFDGLKEPQNLLGEELDAHIPHQVEQVHSVFTTLADFREQNDWNNWSFYYIDLWFYLKYFLGSSKLSWLPGDITYVPNHPTIVKSRPIIEDNANSVLMKLDRLRHFVFINDSKKFCEKENILLWRGGAGNFMRQDFVRKFKNHPLCNVCDINDPAYNSKSRTDFHGGYLSIDEQLNYKFILSLEGNDVATNLKWIMSSNSLCFSPKHHFETWFMEEKLIPNYHYVLIKDDFSDLIDKIQYYSEHSDEALNIIEHAHHFVNQFRNEERENLISILVLQKYFQLTNTP